MLIVADIPWFSKCYLVTLSLTEPDLRESSIVFAAYCVGVMYDNDLYVTVGFGCGV